MHRRSIASAALAALGTLVAGLSSAAAETAREAYAEGDAAYEAEDWEACGGHYARAARLAGEALASTAAYNAACCHALAGNAEEAFEELTRALEAGFRDAELIRTDVDLLSLRDDPRWPTAVAGAATAEEAFFARIHVELMEMFHADQSDRRPPAGAQIDWDVVSPRDEARRARVLEIAELGEMKEPEDYYHAAMVMQHGTELEDYLRAHEWAKMAAEMGFTQAKWLAAAALDRWLVTQGEPQKYGTQYRMEDDQWVLKEVDPSTTDEERAEWDVPPLAEARARANR